MPRDLSKPFTLYWSSLDTFEGCPQSFLWKKGWGAIDVGGGPGRKKPVPVQKSEHHAVMGTAIQAVIERFYNDGLWKILTPMELRDRLLEMGKEEFRLECARRFIDWRLCEPREEQEKLVLDGILGYMKTMKAHKLLGPYAKCEVDMVGYVNKYTPIGGRADLTIRRDTEPRKGVTILDGKNGKRYKDGKGGWMTYTDPDQLRWYALCFYLVYRQQPDHLGFIYYRYPYGAPCINPDGVATGETEEGVVWVPFTQEDLKGLAQRAVDARKKMDKEKFEATPNPKTCRFCDYETVCPQRTEQKDQNRRGPKSSKMPSEMVNATGFTILNFGGDPNPTSGE